jgi:hypothetical protein
MWWRLAIAVVVAVGLFAAGRASAGTSDTYEAGVRDGRAFQAPTDARHAFDDGYQAGANDAFGGFDGGWDYNRPYTITLAKGENGITYRITSRRATRP